VTTDYPIIGADADQWGAKLNDVLARIETKADDASTAAVAAGNSASMALATPRTAAAEAQAARDEAVAAAAAASATSDAALASAVVAAGSQTATALNATYARGREINAVALALPGSKKTGNVRVGAKRVTLASTGHNGFPGFAPLSDGGLIAVWRSAPQHDPTPTPGVIKARTFDTDGTPRGDEYTVLTDALDLRDPMLTRLDDGRLVMQFFKHDGTATTTAGVFLAVSTDDGATFTQLSKVPFTWDSLAASSGRMVVAPNGDWLVAAYGRTSATFNHIRLMRSTDEGQTWTGEVTVAEGQAESRNYVEPVIGVLPDGLTLMCLIRVADSDGSNPAIYRTTSTDNGATWTAEASVVTGGGGRPAWESLASGGVILAHRATTAPYPMQVRTSWDNGATWTSAAQLGPTPNSQGAYAQMVEIARGLVGVVYGIEQDVLSASTVYLGYIADGRGVTPLGDADPALGVMYKGAAEAGLVGGAPTLGQHMGWPSWSMSATAADQVAMVFQIPDDWATFDVSIQWTNLTSNAGDVSFRHDMEQISAGGTLTSVAGASQVVTAAGRGVLVETVATTGLSRTGDYIRVKPTRIGSATADTLADAIGIIGVRLTRRT
jgi:hypothetical protein